MSFRNKDWDGELREESWDLLCDNCGKRLGDHWGVACEYSEFKEEPAKAPEAHPLTEAFEAAIKQATHGKGERHGGEETPFWEQEWYAIAQDTGVGGLMFQGIKKAKEACRKPNQAAFETELLGSLVYLGMAYLYVRKHGFKPRDGG